ncbi:MAG TPA: hypothetical protein VN758_10110 [Solirubrobacterales bacterium]|nr:hypothetical protein [Solirubrobacterales bacterium]
MNVRAIRILMSGLFVALAISTVSAGGASASPAWRFSGVELKGTEVTLGVAVPGRLTVPSAPVVCEHFLYKMIISNSAGTGKGEVTELPLFNCTSLAGECTVEAMTAEKLPWPAHLTTVEGNSYVVIENIKVSILYGGAFCPLKGVSVPVTGSAGALFENASEAAEFSEASFTATKTGLKAFGSSVQWEGQFPMEAFEWSRLQALTVS